MHGIFQMTFFEHVTILHGVGVGGGSLVYANTLPDAEADFFRRAVVGAASPTGRQELAPHYATAQAHARRGHEPAWTTRGDEVLREIAKDMGREEHFHPTDVAVYFGEPGKTRDGSRTSTAKGRSAPAAPSAARA